MKNKLVYTQRGEVYTSSVIVAEKLGVKHPDLLRTLEKVVKRWEKQVATQRTVSSQVFRESTFTNKMNRTYKMYEMNEQAFIKLIMKLDGYEKAEIIQDLFISEFFRMKNALLNQQNQSWLSNREQGKLVHKEEMDVIKDFIGYATSQGSKSANKYYMNITKMTNKALELLIQSKDGKPLRDLATVTELGFIQVVDNRAMVAIADGMLRKLPYKEIYKYAKEEVENIVDSLCFKAIEG